MSVLGFPEEVALKLNLRCVYSFFYLMNNIPPVMFIKSLWISHKELVVPIKGALEDTHTHTHNKVSGQGPGFKLLLVLLRGNHGFNNSLESLVKLIIWSPSNSREAGGAGTQRRVTFSVNSTILSKYYF